ncbi:hypothetical protein [Streptomyces sp. NPDC051452]|uniref:hypothetical protein n=1 Tax=Streptomyces sp. NPDC051452 TaxID=3365654 RepID=UPI0037B32F32
MTTTEIPAGPVEKPPAGFRYGEEQATLLRDTLAAAGVDLGEYDGVIIDWLSHWEWSTVAVIASWIARAATARPPTEPVALPGRFDATPAEVDQHLRRILAEDRVLLYQQAIGGAAAHEAAEDLMTEYRTKERDQAWAFASAHIDPAEGGGPYPSQFQCSQHDGFGPCPGAPRCTPREDTGQ